MIEYTTKDGDVLDRICWQYYKTTDVLVKVLQANEGLVDYGPILPRGVVIKLPNIEKPPEKRKISLW